MIKIQGLDKRFGDLQVLKDINLTINEGEIVSIIGPSGSGKSTLLRCLHQLESIDAGRISVLNQSLEASDLGNKKKAYKLQQALSEPMGMVFQGFNLFPHMTALQNVMEGPVQVKGIDKKTAEALAYEVLDQVGMTEKAHAYPSQLSGGQKQRIAIARTLIMDPEIILFDEPTSALDPELVQEVLAVIKKIASRNITMLIVTHEMQFAKDVSNRVIFMADGRVVVDGEPTKVFDSPDHPRLQQFLGKFA